MTPEIKAKIGAAQPGPTTGWRDQDGRVRLGTKFRSRVVWDEAHPDDPLQPGEVVHHLNGVKDDDRPENLQKLPSQAEHARLHFRRPRTKSHIRAQAEAQRRTKRAKRPVQPAPCEHCGTLLSRTDTLRGGRFCSQTCHYAFRKGKGRTGW